MDDFLRVWMDVVRFASVFVWIVVIGRPWMTLAMDVLG
jgi:hypothetical protein